MIGLIATAGLLVAFQQSAPAPQHSEPFDKPHVTVAEPAPAAPYTSLFKTTPIPQPSVLVPGRSQHQTPTVGETVPVQPGPCNMPTITADASVDPKIVKVIPEDVRKASRIRVIEPKSCR